MNKQKGNFNLLLISCPDPGIQVLTVQRYSNRANHNVLASQHECFGDKA